MSVSLFKTNSLNIAYLLIGANVILFILTTVVTFLFQVDTMLIYEKVQLSIQWENLLRKPWTIISYGFFHTDFFHLFFNMLLLYFGAILFINLFSPKLFLKIYSLGMILGGIIFVVAYHIFPALQGINAYLLGASAGIMSILIFMCVYTPHYQIHLWGVIKLPLWSLGVCLVIFDLISIPFSNSGGRIAHLGGALYGFFAAYTLKNTSLLPKNFFKKKKKVIKKPQNSLIDKEIQDKVDKILDKISKSGYESLNPEEKTFLFKISKEKN